MKFLFPTTLSFALLCMNINQSSAQQKSVPTCTDNIIHQTLVTYNTELEQKGYKLILTKNVTMPNGGIQPVTIDVKQGKEYYINYIPQSNGKKIKLNIWDKDKNEIAKEKGNQGQHLSTKFTSKYTGQMYIFLSQKTKGKQDVCGGISVLEK